MHRRPQSYGSCLKQSFVYAGDLDSNWRSSSSHQFDKYILQNMPATDTGGSMGDHEIVHSGGADCQERAGSYTTVRSMNEMAWNWVLKVAEQTTPSRWYIYRWGIFVFGPCVLFLLQVM